MTPIAATAPEPRLVLEGASVCCYALAPLFVMVWRDAPADAEVDDVHAALRRFLDANPAGISVLSVVERGAAPPSPANRARISAFQRQIGAQLKRIVLLVDGVGFVASVVLAVATSIGASRGAHIPQDVVRRADVAAERLVHDPHVARALPIDALLAAIARVRADAARRAPARVSSSPSRFV